MKSNPSQDPFKETFANGQTRQRKGKGKGQEKTSRKGNHNQDQAGSPNEDGQRTLGDFGLKTSES